MEKLERKVMNFLSTARTCTGAAAGSDELWQLAKFERKVKNFLSTARKGSDDEGFKDFLQKSEVVMMMAVNVAVEKPLVQPVHCVTLCYRILRTFLLRYAGPTATHLSSSLLTKRWQ